MYIVPSSTAYNVSRKLASIFSCNVSGVVRIASCIANQKNVLSMDVINYFKVHFIIWKSLSDHTGNKRIAGKGRR